MASMPPLQVALNAVNSVAPNYGDFSQPWTFSIAGMELQGQEVPDGFELGSDMKFAEHRYINSKGKPVVRTNFQGAYPVPTKWKAVFTRSTALYRAQTLHKLSLAGARVDFVYGPFKFKVQIKAFHYTPKWQTEVDYDIELIVLEDLNGQSTPGLPQNYEASMENLYTNGTAQFLTLYSQDTGLQSADTNDALTAELNVLRP